MADVMKETSKMVASMASAAFLMMPLSRTMANSKQMRSMAKVRTNGATAGNMWDSGGAIECMAEAPLLLRTVEHMMVITLTE